MVPAIIFGIIGIATIVSPYVWRNVWSPMGAAFRDLGVAIVREIRR